MCLRIGRELALRLSRMVSDVYQYDCFSVKLVELSDGVIFIGFAAYMMSGVFSHWHRSHAWSHRAIFNGPLYEVN